MVVCKFKHMCKHVQEKIQSSNSISSGLKKFQKIFKVQFKSTGFEKIFKKFQSPASIKQG